MAIAQHRLTEQDFEAFLLSGIEGRWELHDGVLVEKPAMSWDHQNVMINLAVQLSNQISREAFRVQVESRVRRPEATVLLPDVMVIPDHYGDEFRNQPGRLAIFSRPLPLVAEVWSVSTGEYDVMAKLPIYQQRGDAEIWLIHPYEKTVTSWRRQPDGTYLSSVHHEGTIQPVALPDVVIEIAELFL
jgi:Uma2 family endonuclease